MKALISAKTDEHHTPDEWLMLGRDVMGSFDLDPASCEEANKRVNAARYYTREDDGLVQPWHGRVWINFPGDRRGQNLPRFWIRAVAHAAAGGAVLWAGFSTSQVSRLANLQTVLAEGRDKALVAFAGQWLPDGSALDPHAYPMVYPHGRIAWIEAATGKPQGQPPHANWFALIGGDDAMRARFRDRFGAVGRYVEARKRSGRVRDLSQGVIDVLAQHGPLPMYRLAKAVGARKASVMAVVDELIANNRCSRGKGTVFLTKGETR